MKKKINTGAHAVSRVVSKGAKQQVKPRTGAPTSPKKPSVLNMNSSIKY